MEHYGYTYNGHYHDDLPTSSDYIYSANSINLNNHGETYVMDAIVSTGQPTTMQQEQVMKEVEFHKQLFEIEKRRLMQQDQEQAVGLAEFKE